MRYINSASKGGSHPYVFRSNFETRRLTGDCGITAVNVRERHQIHDCAQDIFRQRYTHLETEQQTV